VFRVRRKRTARCHRGSGPLRSRNNQLMSGRRGLRAAGVREEISMRQSGRIDYRGLRAVPPPSERSPMLRC